MNRHIVILTVKDDLHAYLVGAILKKNFAGRLRLSTVYMDDRSSHGGFTSSLTSSAGTEPVRIKNTLGEWICLDEANLIWCRRFTRAQRGEEANSFLTQQWESAAWFMQEKAKVKWIDSPRHIIGAENKLRQLSCAQQVGFSIPNTLVSQDANDIRNFFNAERDGVIMKPLKASIQKQIYTVRLHEDAFLHPGNFKQFPAIYQQHIGGRQHIRIVCLPQRLYTFSLLSDELDWRKNKNLSIQLIETDSMVEKQCRQLLKALHLTMGVIDAKLLDDKLYFFEVNPQGQFLFLEALSRVNLRSAYADYFKDELLHSNPE